MEYIFIILLLYLYFLKSKMNNENANFYKEYIKELERIKELKKEYQSIGSSGIFGVAMLNQEIIASEKALEKNDIDQMKKCLESMRGCE